MDNTEQIRSDLTHALSLLPTTTLPLTTPEQLDAAISTLPAGSVVTLANSFVYPRALTLTKPLTLRSETHADRVGTRMTIDEPAPRFLAGITAAVDGYRLLSLDVRNSMRGTLVAMSGANAALDRCRLLGDPVKGAHRGIDFSGGAGRISRCYIDDIFAPTQDTQAIGVFDCDAGLVIEDCYLGAAGQSLMFGGADPSSVDRVPRVILVTGCDLVKKPEWVGTQQVKCAIEFKNAIGVVVTGCRLERAGTSQGQGAYLIVATVRNQNGAAPFSCIRNVEISHCVGRFGAGVCNFLGSDNNHPSGPLDGFTIRDSTFTDMDGALGTTGRLFMFDRAPARVALRNLAVTGANISALGYFTGSAPTQFSAAGMSLPTSKYGWKIDGSQGGGSGRTALMRYMPDAALDATIV